MAAGDLAWIDSLAATHIFNGTLNTTPLLLPGAVGLDMPPIAQLDQRTPGQPGTIIRYTDIQPKIITLPLQIGCTSEANFYTLRRTMLDTWFANPGTLQSTDPSSVNRLLGCNYLAGLEGDESEANRGPGHMQVALQLEAPVPFWTDAADTATAVFTNTQLLAGQTITNNGAYLCYPVWTFGSPMTNLVITNTTTGLAIKLTANGGLTMAAGHSLVIDTNAGTVIEDVTSVIQFMTTDSVFFPLVPGANAITFVYTGGVNGTTTGQATYRQRYRSR